MSAAGSGTRSVERSSGVQFEQYVNESRQRLFRFAVVLCGDTVLAGDLVTDVLGRAFERWHLVTAATDPHAYVRRMLVNEFVSWQRRRARTVPHPHIGQLADLRASRLGTSGPDPGEAQAERAALLEELSRLPAGNARRSCCASTRTSATTTSRPLWAAESAQYAVLSPAGWPPCAITTPKPEDGTS